MGIKYIVSEKLQVFSIKTKITNSNSKFGELSSYDKSLVNIVEFI